MLYRKNTFIHISYMHTKVFNVEYNKLCLISNIEWDISPQYIMF